MDTEEHSEPERASSSPSKSPSGFSAQPGDGYRYSISSPEKTQIYCQMSRKEEGEAFIVQNYDKKDAVEEQKWTKISVRDTDGVTYSIDAAEKLEEYGRLAKEEKKKYVMENYDVKG